MNNTEIILNEFDKKIKQLNSYSITICNFIKYIALIIGVLLTMLPASYVDFETFIIISFISEMGFYFHIYPFLYTPEDGIMKSIYRILCHTPIDKKEYFKIRFKKYVRCCSIVFIFCTFLQALGFILTKDYSLKALLLSIIYIIALFVLSVIEGIFTIKISIPKDK